MIKQNIQLTHGALLKPEYPKNIPNNCKWLGGEGYGVWFLITKPEHLQNNEYRIKRFADNGHLDCDIIFELNSDKDFHLDKDFEFAYISHCQKCTITQNDTFFTFKFKKNFNNKTI